MQKQKIMIIDDDEHIAELISLYMIKECFETLIEHDGESALADFDSFAPDLVLLDLMLPGMDGYQVCREIRKKEDTPIIMLSAKGEVFDKVLGLELGADDYVIKPFDSKELVARVKAVLRRKGKSELDESREAELQQKIQDQAEEIARLSDAAGAANTSAATFINPLTGFKEPATECVTYPDLIINLTNYSVEYRGKLVEMPPKELELLYYLASNPNRVFTREQLLTNIWGYEYSGDTRTVDVHIKRLREKIHGHDSWSITTVWGIGYKFSKK